MSLIFFASYCSLKKPNVNVLFKKKFSLPEIKLGSTANPNLTFFPKTLGPLVCPISDVATLNGTLGQRLKKLLLTVFPALLGDKRCDEPINAHLKVF